MRSYRTAAVRHAPSRRYSVLVSAALGFSAFIACSGPAQATGLGEGNGVAEQPESLSPATIETNVTLPGFDRSDCKVEDAVCRSECVPRAGRHECDADPCSSRLMRCLATPPLGKSPSLPVACKAPDEEAFRLLERQGELLDADQTLFTESYNSLIRARIACRAGNHAKALNLYDEIMESMRDKPVASEAASKLGR